MRGSTVPEESERIGGIPGARHALEVALKAIQIHYAVCPEKSTLNTGAVQPTIKLAVWRGTMTIPGAGVLAVTFAVPFDEFCIGVVVWGGIAVTLTAGTILKTGFSVTGTPAATGMMTYIAVGV